MGFYLLVLAVCLVLFVVSLRRSAGSLTTYVLYTGAPVQWLLLGCACAVSSAAFALSADDGLARGIFTGALIGTAFVQIVLMRRRPPSGASADRR